MSVSNETPSGSESSTTRLRSSGLMRVRLNIRRTNDGSTPRASGNSATDPWRRRDVRTVGSKSYCRSDSWLATVTRSLQCHVSPGRGVRGFPAGSSARTHAIYAYTATAASYGPPLPVQYG